MSSNELAEYRDKERAVESLLVEVSRHLPQNTAFTIQNDGGGMTLTVTTNLDDFFSFYPSGNPDRIDPEGFWSVCFEGTGLRLNNEIHSHIPNTETNVDRITAWILYILNDLTKHRPV